jgi:hypothetical protein
MARLNIRDNILTRTLSFKPTGYFKTVQTAPIDAAEESLVRKVNRWDLKNYILSP